jgi:DNA-binding MarR family transcriptional regulator
VTLNIGTIRNAKRSAKRASPATRKLVDEVVDELTSWNPREFITAFQRWHHGAISLIHLNVLTLLEANGPLSMSHLAEGLGISVASATGVVDRMEARGLVERQRHPDDRRVVLVHPAAGAGKVFAEINDRRRKGLKLLLARLSDEQLTGLLAGHRALHAARAELAKQASVDKVTEMLVRARESDREARP